MKYRNQAEIRNIAYLFALGFATSITQIVILREFLAGYGGNEIITGIFLSLWMLITATGSILARGRYTGRSGFNTGLLILGYIPVVLLFLINLLRSVIFLPGIQPGIAGIVLVMCILLPLFCLLSGFMFTYLASSLSLPAGRNMFSRAYGTESTGSLAGGILFTFLFASFLDNFECAALTAIMISVLILIFEASYGLKLHSLLPLAFAVAVVWLFIVTDVSAVSRSFLYPAQEIIRSKDTRYGNITVTQTADQFNFYINNNFLYATGDIQTKEEAVHFAMLQHASPSRILLISGGISGIADEVMKYGSVKGIDLVESDPEIFRIYDDITGGTDIPLIKRYGSDVMAFLLQNEILYDVIIMSLPEPSTIELNNYYTRDFFRLIKTHLDSAGIFSFSLPVPVNYMNDHSRLLNSSVYSTLSTVFGNIEIYPVNSLVYVASDKHLSDSLFELAEIREINNQYVNPFYIDENELGRRADIIKDNIGSGGKVNMRFRPVAVYDYLNLWFSKYSESSLGLRIFAWILTALFLIPLVFFKPMYTGMFSAGFVSASVQLILLLAFQVIAGHLYQALGAFIAVFMAGLAAGAMLHDRQWLPASYYSPLKLQLYLTAIVFLVPAFIHIAAIRQEKNILTWVFLFLPLLLVSLLTGLTYASIVDLAGRTPGYRAGNVYGADLAGAALGAVITALIIIPFTGILYASFIFAVIGIFTIVKIYYREKI